MNVTYAYSHIGLPPSSPLPYLASTLNFTFTSQSTPTCLYLLCARPISAAPDVFSQWHMNCGQHAINLVNLTTTLSTSNPRATGAFYLPPGPAYFSVYSQVANVSVAGDCGFRLEVAGDACVGSGGYGAMCAMPLLLSRAQNVTRQAVGGGAGSFTFAVRPTTTARSQLSLNITTSMPYAVTAFVRHSEPPYLTSSPSTSLYNFNASSYTGNTLWVNLTNPAARLQSSDPASTYRYFVTITPNISTAGPTIATITLNETVCPPGLLNPACSIAPDVYVLFGAISLKLTAGDFSSGVRYAVLDFPDVDQSSFMLGVVETAGNTAPCMLLRLGAVPSLTEYDVQVCPTADIPSTVFYRSYDTLVHDVPWFLAIVYKEGYVPGGSSAQVAVWTDLDCPNDCSGHGDCIEHRCVCRDDYTDYNCADIAVHHNTLSQLARALLPILAIFGGIALGCGICWYFKSRSDAHWEMRARLGGYRLVNGVAADGGGGDGGGGSGGGGGGGSGGSDWRGPGGRGGFGPAGAGGGGAAPPAPAAAPRSSQGFGPRGNIHRL